MIIAIGDVSGCAALLRACQPGGPRRCIQPNLPTRLGPLMAARRHTIKSPSHITEINMYLLLLFHDIRIFYCYQMMLNVSDCIYATIIYSFNIANDTNLIFLFLFFQEYLVRQPITVGYFQSHGLYLFQSQLWWQETCSYLFSIK